LTPLYKPQNPNID